MKQVLFAIFFVSLFCENSVVGQNFSKYRFLPDSLNQVLDTAQAENIPKYIYRYGHRVYQKDLNKAIKIYQVGIGFSQEQQDSLQESYGIYYQALAFQRLQKRDSSTMLFLKSLSLSKSIKDTAMLIRTNELLGRDHLNHSEFKPSTNYYKSALSYSPDSAKQLMFLNRIALNFLIDGKLDSALFYQLRTETLVKTSGDPYRLGEWHQQLAIMYKKSKQLDPAIKHFKISITTLSACLDNIDCWHLTNACQLLMASSFVDKELYDSAKLHFNKLSTDSAYMNSPHVFGFHMHHARLLEKTNKPHEAIKSLLTSNEALRKTTDLNNEFGYITNSYNLGRNYLTIKDYANAKKFTKAAVDWYESHNNSAHLADAYKTLSNSYSKLNNYKQAYLYQKKLTNLTDSLNRIETGKNLQELNTKYEVADKENEIVLLEEKTKNQELVAANQKRNTLILLAALIVVIIVALVIYTISKRIRSLNKRLNYQNDQIKQAEELKTRWFVNVSHELKTPLALVQGPIAKVLDNGAVNEIDKEDLSMANRNLKQLNNLVAEILDISKLENQQIELEMSATNFSNVVRSSVAAFESTAHVNKVLLKTNIESNVWLKIDENKIRKLIQNLLSNALKFTHEGGEITTTLLSKDNEYVLTVSDTGEGINHEDLPYVFDRFYQSKDKNKSRQGGTGIGLALSKEIAQMHDGKLKVQSQKDEGSIFIFELPKSLKCEATESAIVEKTETTNINKKLYEPRLTEKPKLLIVEDNADMRIFIEGVMKKDYALTLARDGKDALEKLNKDHFDLIISDVMMPRMDGLTLIREVKKSKKWNEIPFIILTALNNEEERIHTLRTGIDDYLSKPFNPEELKVRSANLLANQQNRNTNDIGEIESYDDKLLKTLEREVNDYMTNSILSVAYLADKVAMSERNLRRYLKKVTGLSPSGFILEIKLQKALTFLESRTYPTVKEIAAYSGFERADRFSNAFTKRFGKKPGEYLS